MTILQLGDSDRLPGATRFGRALALAQLRESWFEVTAIPFRAHPAARAFDARQLARAQTQELVRLARPSLHANAVLAALDGTDASDATIRHTNTISDDVTTVRHVQVQADKLQAWKQLQLHAVGFLATSFVADRFHQWQLVSFEHSLRVAPT